MKNLTKQFILGSLLGDGSLNKKYHKRYSEIHSIKQKEYLKWKKDIFEKDFKVKYREYTRKNGYKECGLWFSDNSLKKIYQLIYINDRRTITKKLLNQLNHIALAILHQDDGNLNGTILKIAVCNFSDKECNLLINWIKTKYNINFIFYKSKNKNKLYNMIKLNKEEIPKFINLIKKYIHPSMNYKINLEESIKKKSKKTKIYHQKPEVRRRRNEQSKKYRQTTKRKKWERAYEKKDYVKDKKNKRRREKYHSDNEYKEKVKKMVMDRYFKIKNTDKYKTKMKEYMREYRKRKNNETSIR